MTKYSAVFFTKIIQRTQPRVRPRHGTEMPARGQTAAEHIDKDTQLLAPGPLAAFIPTGAFTTEIASFAHVVQQPFTGFPIIIHRQRERTARQAQCLYGRITESPESGGHAQLFHFAQQTLPVYAVGIPDQQQRPIGQLPQSHPFGYQVHESMYKEKQSIKTRLRHRHFRAVA